MKVDDLAIPRDWTDVTPGWMTAALSDEYPGVEVAEVTLLLRDDGTNRRARFGLRYVAECGPATVFAKAADPAHSKLNAATGGLFNEPRLFQSGVALPVDHPDVYAAVIDEPGLDYLILMEDVVARGADPRDATRPITVEQAASGVRGLARLHSRYWGAGVLNDDSLQWVQPFLPWSRMGSTIPAAFEMMGDTVPPAVRAMTVEDIIQSTWTRYINTLTMSPQTLLHGDPHIGNTYVLPDDDVGFLDWQVVRRGNWSLDVGYFLQGALTVEDRRSSERQILEEYRTALELAWQDRPSAEEVFLRYRASVSHGLAIWLSTLGGGAGWQRPEVSLALAQRYAAAFVDLETAAALESIDS